MFNKNSSTVLAIDDKNRNMSEGKTSSTTTSLKHDAIKDNKDKHMSEGKSTVLGNSSLSSLGNAVPETEPDSLDNEIVIPETEVTQTHEESLKTPMGSIGKDVLGDKPNKDLTESHTNKRFDYQAKIFPETPMTEYERRFNVAISAASHEGLGKNTIGGTIDPHVTNNTIQELCEKYSVKA